MPGFYESSLNYEVHSFDLTTVKESNELENVEKNILRDLVAEQLQPMSGLQNPDAVLQESLKSDVSGVMFESIYPSTSTTFAVMSEFKKNTDVDYENSNINVITHALTTVGSDQQSEVANNVSLGQNTAPLFVSHVSLNFTDGNNDYVSAVGSHKLHIPDDPDKNLFKAMNSKHSNTASQPSNLISGGFDNQFNNSHALYTENVVERDAENNKLSVGSAYNSKISSHLNRSEAHPNSSAQFGSLKIVQDPLQVTVESSLDDESTLSRTNPNHAAPPDSYTESEFLALFNQQTRAKVGPGYSLELNVSAGGGYSLDGSNVVVDRVYDASYEVQPAENVSLMSLDESSLAENYKYMTDVAKKEHKIVVQNGRLLKSVEPQNANFNDFTVMDGFEFLNESDSNTNGMIQVLNTSNVLGSENARYEKVPDGSGSIERLVVNYESSEQDYLQSVGSLSENMQTNHDVDVSLSCLLKSTDTGLDLWTSAADVASHNNSVLVFQQHPNVPSFDKDDVSAFTSNLSVSDNKFVLFRINNKQEFHITQEGNMFRSGVSRINPTGQLQKIDDRIVTDAEITGVNLNDLKIRDIRVGFTPRNVNQFPQIEHSRGDGKRVLWRTAAVSNLNGSPVVTDVNVNINTNENGGYVMHLPGSSDINNNTRSLLNYLKNSSDLGGFNADTSLNMNMKLRLPEEESSNFENLGVILDLYVTWNDLLGNERFAESTVQGSSDIHFAKTRLSGSSGPFEAYTFEEVNNALPAPKRMAKITRTRVYNISVRMQLSSYDNLFVTFERVKEKLTYYEGYFNDDDYNKAKSVYADANAYVNANQSYPDIATLNKMSLSRLYQLLGVEASNYRISRSLDDSNAVEANAPLLARHLAGFDVRAWYQSSDDENIDAQNAEWKELQLAGAAVADFYAGIETELYFKNEYTGDNFYGPLRLSVDANDARYPIGDLQDLSGGQAGLLTNDMYYLNLSMAEGEQSIEVSGYEYDVSHARYIPETWSPYVSEHLFLSDEQNQSVGRKITGLTTLVTRNNVSPNNLSEPEQLIVTVKKNASELFKFTLREYMLENFNVIHCKKPVMRADITVGGVLGHTHETKYLTTVADTNPNLFHCKIANGVRAEIKKSVERHDSAGFSLLSDIVQILPLPSYIGKYSSMSGERITENAAALPDSTDATDTRNVRPLKFRGFKNSQSPIELLRTRSTLKMKFGTTHEHDAGQVWTNKDSRVAQINQSVGDINLGIITNFSMMPERDCVENVYSVKVPVEFAKYTKVVVNPLEASVAEDVSGSVATPLLHDYETFDLIASRVKVYQHESYKLSYSIPDLKVYTSPEYVVNAEDHNNWTLSSSYSDAVLRSDGFDRGVWKFKRSQINISSHTAYATLPRPSFYLEALSVKDLPGQLPANLNTIDKRRWYADVNLSGKHNPFSESQSGQQRASVEQGSGLVNVDVSLNIAHELTLRNSAPSSFMFDLTTNKLKIDICVGLSSDDHHSCQEHFNGYVSELTNDSKWKTTKSASQSSKLWNLRFKQLLGPLSSLIVSEKESLLDNNIHVNGIPSHALGNYTLDLRLADSVQMHYYGYNLIQDPENKKVTVLFNKYSTTEALHESEWGRKFFNVPVGIRPTITKREYADVFVVEPDELNDNPTELIDRLRSISIDNLAGITWQTDVSFGYVVDNCGNIVVDNSGNQVLFTVRAPIRLSALTVSGRDFIHELLHVTQDSPVKVIRAVRPDIMRVNSMDGNSVVRITADGQILAPMLDVYGIYLHPLTWQQSDVNGPVNKSLEFFYGNVTSMQSTF